MNRDEDCLEEQRRQWLRHEDSISVWVSRRIFEWQGAASPLPAATYFTAGLERTVAYLIEEAVKKATRG